jgi:hypothetical protein
MIRSIFHLPAHACRKKDGVQPMTPTLWELMGWLKCKMLAWLLGSDGGESGGGEPSLDQRQA